MSEETQNPIPFSVLLAECEAELAEKLQIIQALAATNKVVFTEQVEAYIKALAQTVSQLRRLINEKWEQTTKPNSYGYDVYWRDGKLSVDLGLLESGLAFDIISVPAPAIEYYKKDAVIKLRLANGREVYVKAKRLKPPIQNVTLQKVALKDGNTAWLTPETLKAVRELITLK